MPDDFDWWTSPFCCDHNDEPSQRGLAALDAAVDLERLGTGLRSAELDGAFRAGATGRLTDRSGRESEFVVDEVVDGLRCRYHVRLPGGRLVLDRILGPGATASVRHEVAFGGPLALVWAVMLGRAFRRQLPPTLTALVATAE